MLRSPAGAEQRNDRVGEQDREKARGSEEQEAEKNDAERPKRGWEAGKRGCKKRGGKRLKGNGILG